MGHWHKTQRGTLPPAWKEALKYQAIISFLDPCLLAQINWIFGSSLVKTHKLHAVSCYHMHIGRGVGEVVPLSRISILAHLF